MDKKNLLNINGTDICYWWSVSLWLYLRVCKSAVLNKGFSAYLPQRFPWRSFGVGVGVLPFPFSLHVFCPNHTTWKMLLRPLMPAVPRSFPATPTPVSKATTPLLPTHHLYLFSNKNNLLASFHKPPWEHCLSCSSNPPLLQIPT